jgi:uncharacterized protein (DUF934 family)
VQLVKNGKRVADNWRVLDAGATIPAQGDIVVSPQLWAGEHVALALRAGRIGVILQPDDEVEAIVADLPRFDLVVLSFPTFVDGRHYSTAMLLRGRYGYNGELRATGDVQRDQLFYLARCGFDSFQLSDDMDINAFLQGLQDFSGVYQYALDPRTPAYRRRASYN